MDPYATPATTGQPTGPYATSAITEGVVRQLQGTKPWVRLISVVFFIGVGFMLIGGLVMVVGGAAMFSNIPVSGSGPKGSAAFPAAMFTGMAVAYLIFGILYLYPAVKLWKYANRIGDLVRSGQSADLESALNEQRAFWKFFGVIIVLMLALYGLVFLVVIVGGAVAAARG